jgi:hypothetical protein
MCDYCALSPSQRLNLLQKFHSLLADDGSLLLDVYSLNAFEKQKETVFYEHCHMNGFWSSQDYYTFVNTFKYPVEKVVLDRYTILEENHIWQVDNWLQYFSPETLSNEIQNGGFRIQEILATLDGSPYYPCNTEFAVVAKKI